MSTPVTETTVAVPTQWVTRDVVYVLFTQLVFGFGWALYLLTPKFLATQLHAGPDVIGQISAMGGAAGLVAVPFAGFALDRFGRRLFFQLGSGLLLLLSLGFTQVHEVGPLLYLLQGCISAAFVMAYNATAALLSDYAPPARLGQAIGWAGSANVFMNAVSTMVAEPVAAEYGWHMVFWLGVGSGALALVLSIWLRESAQRPRHSDPGARASASGPPRFSLVVPLLAASLLSGCVFISMFGFIQPYAISAGASEVRGFFLGFTSSAVLVRVFLGTLGDRFGRRRISVLMLAGYAVSTFVVRGLQPDLLIGYGLLFGAAHGVLYPTLNALVLEALPPLRRGLGMVMYNGAFNVGAGLGSLGWGLVAQRYDYPAVYAVAAGTSLFAAAILMVGGLGRAKPGELARPRAG